MYVGTRKIHDKDIYRANLSIALDITDKLPMAVQYELLKDFQNELEMKIESIDEAYEI